MTLPFNKIICGSAIDVLKETIPDNSIDLVVTSPPYDTIRTYEELIGGLVKKYNGYSFPFEQIAIELYRVMKKGGVIVWVVGDAVIAGSETGSSFRQALFFKELGILLLSL